MARPDTCGAAGGAISLWANLGHCPNHVECGIVSSRAIGSSGSIIYCTHDYIRQDNCTNICI